MNSPELAGTAFSYIRFSSRRQERGDSIRRQTELRNRWLARHPAVTLDQSLTFADLGKSAFRGKHRLDPKNALSQFLEAVESGRVKAGSILILENLDRLTREDELAATHLFTGILLSGIRVVTVEPEQMFDRQSGQLDIMRAVIELSRGHGESKRKSTLVGAAWTKKRRAAVAGKPITKAGPAWLTSRNGRFEFRPGAKRVVRRVFAMATAGHGCRVIAKRLNDEGVKLWTGRPWYEQYVRNILRGRESIGEYQPRRCLPGGGRENDGDAIPGYYPAAVTEAEWNAANVALTSRTYRGARPSTRGEHVNVFQGLVWDAKSGDRLQVHMNRHRTLLPAGAKNGGESGVSFPLDVFEGAVLSQLAELDPREILDSDDGPDEVAELSARVARIDARLRELTALFDGDDEVVPEVADKIRAKNAERKKLVEDLDKAKAKAASPLSSAWGECKGLVEVLDQAKDAREVRVRLRQALARMVERIDCLFPAGRGWRLAAVQVRFAGGRHRDYLIAYTPPHSSGRPGKWSVGSFADLFKPGEFDLRNRDDAADLEAALAAIDPKRLTTRSARSTRS